MMNGFKDNGEMTSPSYDNNGNLKVKVDEIKVNNDNNNPVPTRVINLERLIAMNTAIVGTIATEISINATKVTDIELANYSEDVDVAVTIGNNTYTLGAGLAVNVPVNENINSISFATSLNTAKIAYVIKGVI